MGQSFDIFAEFIDIHHPNSTFADATFDAGERLAMLADSSLDSDMKAKALVALWNYHSYCRSQSLNQPDKYPIDMFSTYIDAPVVLVTCANYGIGNTMSNLINQETGYSVISASHNAFVALVLSIAYRPDVVILDYHTVGMTGDVTHNAMIIDPFLKNSRFMSVSANEDEWKKYCKQHSIPYFAMPFSIDRVIDQVATLMNQ